MTPGSSMPLLMLTSYGWLCAMDRWWGGWRTRSQWDRWFAPKVSTRINQRIWQRVISVRKVRPNPFSVSLPHSHQWLYIIPLIYRCWQCGGKVKGNWIRNNQTRTKVNVMTQKSNPVIFTWAREQLLQANFSPLLPLLRHLLKMCLSYFRPGKVCQLFWEFKFLLNYPHPRQGICFVFPSNSIVWRRISSQHAVW